MTAVRKANNSRKRHSTRPGPIDRFLALPDGEKERIWEGYHRGVPFSETRPPTPAERKLWEKAKTRMGRSRLTG